MLVFEEGRKPAFPGKNLSEQSRELTNSESIPGYIGGRRVLHHCASPVLLFAHYAMDLYHAAAKKGQRE